MNTIKLEGQKPLMIAHRGLSGIECENTCPAFVLAGSKDYYGIETDVHISADGQFVICHDSDIIRVAGGHSMIIEDSRYDDLRAVPLVNPRHGDRRSDLFIPLLSDYIAICKKYDKRAVLEIKTDFSEAQLTEMLAIIDAQNYRNQVTFISFVQEPLVRLRAMDPSAVCQFLTDQATDETLAFLDAHGFDLDIAYPTLTKDYVDRVHAHGHKVNCWTVDDPAHAATLIAYGVDFITSNILE